MLPHRMRPTWNWVTNQSGEPVLLGDNNTAHPPASQREEDSLAGDPAQSTTPNSRNSGLPTQDPQSQAQQSPSFSNSSSNSSTARARVLTEARAYLAETAANFRARLNITNDTIRAFGDLNNPAGTLAEVMTQSFPIIGVFSTQTEGSLTNGTVIRMAVMEFVEELTRRDQVLHFGLLMTTRAMYEASLDDLNSWIEFVDGMLEASGSSHMAGQEREENQEMEKGEDEVEKRDDMEVLEDQEE